MCGARARRSASCLITFLRHRTRVVQGLVGDGEGCGGAPAMAGPLARSQGDLVGFSKGLLGIAYRFLLLLSRLFYISGFASFLFSLSLGGFSAISNILLLRPRQHCFINCSVWFWGGFGGVAR